ncbi:MAG TPA: sodium-translocating pyrophosphatase [Chloroflexi bacterium]|jgi:K(+)-stimulated pyrophosphate-energized sodium pump|nr:sodium-translocating pyrophosphatase [Chloroflexota bacterium]
MVWELVALLAGAISIGLAAYLYRWVMAQPNDNPQMKEFSEAIQVGAAAYLRRLYQALAGLAAVLFIIVLIVIGWQSAVAFLAGALCSGIAGYFGMYVATRANARVAWAARTGLEKAFPVGFFAGAVMGMSVVGLALIGMTVLLMIFGDPEVVLGFSFGASLMALLAKAGGGIYTKTADIGADLVGKVEFDLAEDDPRNPAVIADNVGDNVGDVAGMGADIFDSYVASVVAVMILGYALYRDNPAYVLYPLLLSAAGILASMIGMLFVRTGGSNDPGRALNTGTLATTGIFAILALGVVYAVGVDQPMGIYWPTIAGLLAGIVIGFTSDRFTDIDQNAVQSTANAANTGPAILILDGFSYGLVSIVPSIVGIVIAMVAAWFLAEQNGLAGTYGVSVAAVGMLAITGMIVSSDAYGPIVDNAKGCAEAGHEDEETIRVCDRLDAAGNTAKAITKGFAIGAAALTVLALFSAYAETVGLTALDLLNPGIIVGLFLGSMMPPLFSAMTMLSVSRNAFKMVEEIRRQFREIPGILEGTVPPDSTLCVDIATQGALRELVGPGVLALVVPIAVGLVLGTHALGGFLAGSIVTGIIFALFMANAGGLWDNAKKFIEDGAHGGPGSEAHKAAVVGDTVGDPFKDTAGPSLNTLITVMSLVATVFAPLIARFALFAL